MVIGWRMRLHEALRTALACGVVGGVTLYGPRLVASQIKFPAFSYLTVMTIMSNSPNVGSAIRGWWHVVCATAQVVPLGMVVGWWWGAMDEGCTVVGAGVVIAMVSFVVAMTECTHLTAKRIAFGQIVVVCSDLLIYSSDDYLHPVHVAASTALGAFASVLAFTLPYPDLPSYKIQKLCHAYSENASQRMKLYVRAFMSRDNWAKKEVVSKSKTLAESGAKLLHRIEILQEALKWERPWSRRCLKPSLWFRLSDMDLQLRGMEYSLDSSPDCPLQVIHQQILSRVLRGRSMLIQHKLEQISRSSPLLFQSATQVESRKVEILPPLDPAFPILNHGWLFLFFSCIDMLLYNNSPDNDCDIKLRLREPRSQNKGILGALKTWIPRKERLQFAFKCSLSLGLAVTLGSIFDKRNGCWAGLAIATSFVTRKQAVFTVANTRAQGTAMGSVYGVICCFLFRYQLLKLLALLPWIIFSSFLKHSKMYSDDGGVSATIGALLILGRKNYGDPNEFSLARLTTVFIGLSTFLIVELCMQPMRAAELAKNSLQTTLISLHDFIKEIRNHLLLHHKNHNTLPELRNKHRNFNILVQELKSSVAEACLEPDFCFSPFPSSCYQALAEFLSKMADITYFIIQNFEALMEVSETSTTAVKEFYQQVNAELELHQELINSSLEYLDKAHPAEHTAHLSDPEIGNPQNPPNITDFITEHEDNKELQERTIQCISATRFCFSTLMTEIEKTAVRIREIN